MKRSRENHAGAEIVESDAVIGTYAEGMRLLPAASASMNGWLYRRREAIGEAARENSLQVLLLAPRGGIAVPSAALAASKKS